MATEKTPSSKHGRLHEEEAKRDVTHDWAPANKQTPLEDVRNPVFHEHSGRIEQERQKNREMRAVMDHVAAQKPVAKPAPKAKPDITHRMDALRSALSDKYPHNDVEVIPEGLKVAVPTGHITIESEKVAACADNAALRAYIDSLPIQ